MHAAFSLMVEQDQRAKKPTPAEARLAIRTFSSPEVFVNEYPTTAPLFTKQVALSFNISAAGDTGASSPSTTKPMSLADQMRADMKKQQEESTKKEEDKEDQKGKQRAPENDAVSPPLANAADNDASSVDPMRNRVSGYAPRGRRGRYGALAPAATASSRAENGNEQKDAGSSSSSSSGGGGAGGNEIIETIYPPEVRDDMKRSINVDSRMPVSSEKAFRSVMTCVFTSLLLRDRPFGEILEQQQEFAEKALAQTCVKLAWEYHKHSFIGASVSSSDAASFSELNEQFAKLVTADDVAAILPPLFSFDGQEEQEGGGVSAQSALSDAIFNTYLRPINFLLPPLESLVPFALTPVKEEDVDDDLQRQNPFLCRCDQVAGTLENIKWQVIRRNIDFKGDLSAAMGKVLEHWDPLNRFSKQFPTVHAEWVLLVEKKEEEEKEEQDNATEQQEEKQQRRLRRLREVVASPVAAAARADPVTASFATRILESVFGATAAAAAGSKQGGGNDEADEEKQKQRRLAVAMKIFAADLLILLDLTAAAAAATDKKVLLRTVMRWWAVFLRETCPVHSTKVF